jgi:hypothetical protein
MYQSMSANDEAYGRSAKITRSTIGSASWPLSAGVVALLALGGLGCGGGGGGGLAADMDLVGGTGLQLGAERLRQAERGKVGAGVVGVRQESLLG